MVSTVCRNREQHRNVMVYMPNNEVTCNYVSNISNACRCERNTVCPQDVIDDALSCSHAE